MLTPFIHVASMVIRLFLSRKKKHTAESVYAKNLAKDLKKLSPGIPDEQLLERYYAEKLGLVFAILLIGFVFGACVIWQENSTRSLFGGNRILRGSYEEKAKQVEAEARVENYGSKSFSLNVQGQVPPKQEADRLEEVFWEKLCETALGDNLSWQQVAADLCLEESIAGYPFRAEWKSGSPYWVDDVGRVRSPEKDQIQKVELCTVITWENWEWEHTLDITIMPPKVSEEERMYQELEHQLMQLELDTRQEKEFSLPKEWEGNRIEWIQKTKRDGILLWLMTATVGILLFFLKDRDLHEKVKARERLLREDYPLIVHKLSLYLGAGLTIRGAFMRTATEGKRSRPVFQELILAGREFETGMAEAEVYERFGRRCGMQEYVRLGALLTQNLKKGGSALLVQLSEEADRALREQINGSRKIGEEASTKLLIPMVMMLAIVMIMIMVPAFGAF